MLPLLLFFTINFFSMLSFSSVFGLRLDNRIAKVLASPMAQMLSRVHGDTDLDFERRAMLYDALYRAFLLEAGNDAKWLDALLSERGLPLPAKP